MIREDEYYTPTIDEFHVGFKHGLFLDLGIPSEPNIKWLDDLRFCMEMNPTWDLNARQIHKLISEDKVRVKYLDREDIESLGFNLIETEPHDLYSREVDKNHTWLLTPQFFDKGCDLRVWIASKNSVVTGGYFDGIIKNKSELKKVLKQIGYED